MQSKTAVWIAFACLVLASGAIVAQGVAEKPEPAAPPAAAQPEAAPPTAESELTRAEGERGAAPAGESTTPAGGASASGRGGGSGNGPLLLPAQAAAQSTTALLDEPRTFRVTPHYTTFRRTSSPAPSRRWVFRLADGRGALKYLALHRCAQPASARHRLHERAAGCSCAEGVLPVGTKAR